MKPNIFEYSNYREYIKAFCLYSKEIKSKVSNRYFAQKVGFSSSGLLTMITNGQRNLSKDYLPKFAEVMGLSKREKQYFEILVSFNQADNPEAKRYYLELLHNLKKEKIGTVLKDDQFEYFSNWYYAVIRELVALPHFNEDPNWIRKQLHNKVTSGEIKEAIEKLLRLGLIVRDESGTLRQNEANISTEDEVASTALYSFHQQMMSFAKEVLAKTYGAGTKISGITLPVSKRQFKDIKEMINNFEHEVMRYLAQNPDVPESVSQINIQFFPIAADSDGGIDE